MLLEPKPREKSSRIKNSSLPSNGSVASHEKSSLPPLEEPKDGFSFSVEEVLSSDHVPSKVLTKEMIAAWKVRFHDVIDKMYAYDPKRGEQNR